MKQAMPFKHCHIIIKAADSSTEAWIQLSEVSCAMAVVFCSISGRNQDLTRARKLEIHQL
jgi:hypothetical protein